MGIIFFKGAHKSNTILNKLRHECLFHGVGENDISDDGSDDDEQKSEVSENDDGEHDDDRKAEVAFGIRYPALVAATAGHWRSPGR